MRDSFDLIFLILINIKGRYQDFMQIAGHGDQLLHIVYQRFVPSRGIMTAGNELHENFRLRYSANSSSHRTGDVFIHPIKLRRFEN